MQINAFPYLLEHRESSMKQRENNLLNLDDASLLKCMVSHRSEVLSILYDRYEKRIYYKALSLVKNSEEAKDLSHDIFIKIFTNLNKFQGRSNFSLWVHSISFNTCVKYLKDKKKLKIFDLDDSSHDAEDKSSQDISEKLLLEIDLDSLQQNIGLLKEEERLIILMKYIDCLTIREISEITKLKESNIKMKLMRTREKLLQMHNCEKNRSA